jgi:uncharacterized protein (TIGR02284 family)
MPVTTHDIIEALNDLIETCEDGKHGYQTAAEGADELHIKEILLNYADQRARFTEELKEQVERFTDIEEEIEDSGSTEGAIHRGWINIKQLITGNSITDILDECERGEDVAVDTYRDALGKSLPNDVKQVIKEQYREIQKAHDHIKHLRESTRGEAAA